MNRKNACSHAFVIAFILYSLTGFAQLSAGELDRAMNKIETYQYQNPTRGKGDLLELLTRNPGAPDTCKGKIFINLATAFGMLNQLDSGLWAINRSLSYLSEKDNARIHALYKKAILHQLKGEYRMATSAISSCLQLNDSIWKNQPFKAAALQEYANLCTDQHQCYQATRLYLQALDVVRSPGYKDPKVAFNTLKIEINLAEAYAMTGNHGFAINTFLRVLPKLDSMKDYDGFIRSGYHLADSWVKTGQYRRADSLAKKLLPMTESLNNEELKSYIILNQGICRSLQRKYGEALVYYRECFALMEKNKSAFILDCATPYLTALQQTNGQEEARKIIHSQAVHNALSSSGKIENLNFKKAAIYFIRPTLSSDQLYTHFLEILTLSDEVNREGQLQQAMEMQAKYNIEQKEKNEQLLIRENKLLAQHEVDRRKQIYLIILIAAFLLTSIFLLYLRLRQRAHLQAKALDIQRKENEIQKQQTAWAVQEKQLRDELLEQQKIVLSRTLADSEELKIKLNEIVAEQEQIRRKELMTEVEKAMDERSGLEKLLLQFQRIHPGFSDRLHQQYPKLSQSDMQFCVLYKMNLSTKEISTLLHVEPRSIYIKKYRIMDKMALGKDEDFDGIIFNQG